MRNVLSGNEALARGAHDAGVYVVSSYPGTPSTEITEYAAKYNDMYVEWATNEKVATEVAIGASLAGVRSLTAMKHVGLNVAADPIMTSSYTGVNGGMVVIVADDPNMYSSQNEQDSRHYARMSKLPMMEPSDSQEAYDYIRVAYDISQRYSCPVFVRSTTRVSHSMSVVNTGERTAIEVKEYQKDPLRWVMTPVNARARHKVVEERLNSLAVEADNFITLHNAGKSELVITSGVVYQYAAEALQDKSILKLGMIWPLPVDKIKEISAGYKKVYVLEELDRIIETELKAAGLIIEDLHRPVTGELCVDSVRSLFTGKSPELTVIEGLPMRPPNMCAGCSHRGIYYAISRLKLAVTGDIGCYTLGYMPPLSAVDSCVCMGASVSMAHGFDRGSKGERAKRAVGVIGDSTFLHTGINGLINSVYNQGVSTIVIVDNRITGMTGHQPNPASGMSIKGTPAPKLDIETLCRAVGVKYVVKVDPFDVEKCMQVLKEETAREEVSVIITDRPCIFADKGAIKPPYEISVDNCSGCKMCLRLGCPAISWDEQNRHAVIDAGQCTGCGLCPKVCRFGAITQILQ